MIGGLPIFVDVSITGTKKTGFPFPYLPYGIPYKRDDGRTRYSVVPFALFVACVRHVVNEAVVAVVGVKESEQRDV